MTALRVHFYVQHLLGIGHLVRASRIAHALHADGFEVAVISGGMPVNGFPGIGIESIALPPIKASDEAFTQLIDGKGEPVGDATWNARRSLLVDLVKERRPDIVITEAFPFGRRQMRKELLAFLEAAWSLPSRPLIVSSIRDILQENRKPGRAEETVETINTLFDHVLVHGDEDFVRLEETFPLAGRIKSGVSYTGLVAGPQPEMPAEHYDVVVSAGGGAAGGRLLRASLEAAALLASADAPWCVITGPNLGFAVTAPPNVRLESFRSDFPSLLAGAGLSISQAGYNTVCDILRANCRSILVPFAAGGETEQSLRAERLAQRKRALVVPEHHIDAAGLIATIGQARSLSPDIASALNLDGARRTAEILRDLNGAKHGR